MGTRTKRIAKVVTGTAGLAGLLAAAALAASPNKGTYTGTTDQLRLDAQDRVVSLRVNKNHKVVRFEIGWRAKCDKKGKFWTGSTQIDNPRNEPDGIFHDKGTYTTTTQSGYRGDIAYTLNGHFTDKTHAKGSWKANVKVFGPKGKKVDNCAVSTHWHVAP